jgi:hypothetical protein
MLPQGQVLVSHGRDTHRTPHDAGCPHAVAEHHAPHVLRASEEVAADGVKTSILTVGDDDADAAAAAGAGVPADIQPAKKPAKARLSRVLQQLCRSDCAGVLLLLSVVCMC